MRFRLGTTGGQQAADGIGRGLSAFFGAPLAAAQGAAEYEKAKSEADLQAAHTALYNQQAQELRDQAQGRSLPELISSAAMMNKVHPSQIPEVQQYVQTGELPSKYSTAADGMGPALPAPSYADANGLGGQIMRTLGLLRGGLTVGDKNIEHIAGAQGAYQKQDAVGEIVKNPALAPLYGQGFAATEGKPLVENIGNTGETFNRFTGKGDVASPGLRVLYGDVQNANIGRDRAAASASNALAEQRRAVTEAGPSGAGGKAPSGYRYVAGPDGEMRLEPIPGGPKDPSSKPSLPLPASASKGYLDNLQNLRRAERALALVSGETVNGVQGDPEATGWKGIVPGAILNRLDQEGVNTRAAIADLGSLVIHDRSGAAVTAAEMPRLAPFIPNPTDDAATVKKKLHQFVANYRSVIDDATNFYRASGYAVPDITPTSAPAAGGPARIASDAEYNALPSGAVFVGPDGKQRRKP